MKRLEPQQMLGLRVMGKKGLDAYVEIIVSDSGKICMIMLSNNVRILLIKF